MQKKKLRIRKILIVFLLLIACLFTPFFSFSNNVVSAVDIVKYSNVLVDLSKDENFDISQYPAKEDDYSLRVIQVAEGVNGELFVYVYQPAVEKKLLPATCINMANDFESQDFHLCDLELINKNRTLVKYKVKDFQVNKEKYYRYYNIASIYRKWYKGIDEDTGNDNTINEVSFVVGKKWTTCTVNDQVQYGCTETETILVTDKYTGAIRYINGYVFFEKSCDSHYIAFSTDRKIESLLEARVSFVTEDVTVRHNLTGDHEYSRSDPVQQEVDLKSDETVVNPGGWIGSGYHKWNRIENITDFIANEKIKGELLENIKDKQWVLRFYETEYKRAPSSITGVEYSYHTEVSQETILQLTFETAGQFYNVGVVDNKQTGVVVPSPIKQTPWWVWLIIAIVAIVFIAILLATLLPKLFALIVEGIVKVVTLIAQGIWWLITLPFKVIRKSKEK